MFKVDHAALCCEAILNLVESLTSSRELANNSRILGFSLSKLDHTSLIKVNSAFNVLINKITLKLTQIYQIGNGQA